MTLPPLIRVTHAELLHRFTEGGWAARLDMCQRILYNEQTASGIVGYQFKEAGKYIAVVFYTKHPNGDLTGPVPHRLLIDGTWYYV